MGFKPIDPKHQDPLWSHQCRLHLNLKQRLLPQLMALLNQDKGLKLTLERLEGVGDPNLVGFIKVLKDYQAMTIKLKATTEKLIPYAVKQMKLVRPKRKGVQHMINCYTCGSSFLGHRLAKYCSEACRPEEEPKGPPKKREGPPKRPVNCEVCGKEFLGTHKSKWCSADCKELGKL